MPRQMPAQKPGRSVQEVRTPPEFLAAVKSMLHVADFDCDLAATDDNTVADLYYTEAENALVQAWPREGGWNWLNPPFGDLAPWVAKAWREAGRGVQTAMLVPAGVGANWWRDWVHLKARVLLLNGRLTFVGHPTPYPKDLCLLLYGPPTAFRATFPDYTVWVWRANAWGPSAAPSAVVAHPARGPRRAAGRRRGPRG